jgi:cytochrome c nitrite reductase small subunit
MRGLAILSVLLAALVGMLAGVGTFTFGYGAGHSYLSDDPGACVNCHIMQDQYDSWLKSSHAPFAVCNDCHLPEGFLGRWITKGSNGFAHGWAFTFQDFHEPIQIKPRNLEVLQERCIGCHESLVHPLLPADPAEGGLTCMHCHHSVGHAARGAGSPRRLFPGGAPP